jgi:hypothetical protein
MSNGVHTLDFNPLSHFFNSGGMFSGSFVDPVVKLGQNFVYIVPLLAERSKFYYGVDFSENLE